MFSNSNFAAEFCSLHTNIKNYLSIGFKTFVIFIVIMFIHLVSYMFY